MKLNKVFIALVIILALVVIKDSFKTTTRIRSPRLGNPQMVLQEANFEIVVDGLLPFIDNDVKFSVTSDDSTYDLEVTTVRGNTFTTNSQSELEPGVYKISAKINGKLFENPKAIFVYKEFPNDFSIFHAADLPDIDGGDSEKLLNALIEDVQLEQPELLLLTGDLVYHGGAERYDKFYQAISKLNIPIIICPGNHEREDWSLYLNYFPDPIHSNSFGKLAVISLDSAHGREQLSNNQLSWFEDQLNNNTNKEILVQIHHPVVGARSIERNQQKFINLLKRHGVSATLSGHTHVDAFHTADGNEWLKNELPSKPWLLTTTTYDYDVAPAPNGGLTFPGYRILEYKNNELVTVGKLYEQGRSFMSNRVNLDTKLKK
ncbi:MAG: metallophosphoesterase [Planctomycetes bacterium]|nr:metallophosphoesterase [Planctomycetota bacterium]